MKDLPSEPWIQASILNLIDHKQENTLPPRNLQVLDLSQKPLHFLLGDKFHSIRASLDQKTVDELKFGGFTYYLNSQHGEIRKDQCFLIGDSAGLATVDLGEGIGPAIESAIAVAGEITGTGYYSKGAMTLVSTAGFVGALARKFLLPKELAAMK